MNTAAVGTLQTIRQPDPGCSDDLPSRTELVSTQNLALGAAEAEPADLALGDAAHPHGFDEIANRARRHAKDVGLLMGYPVVTTGLGTMPRGGGTLASTIIVGRLVRAVDNRILMALGLSLGTVSLVMMSQMSLLMGEYTAMMSGFVQGLGRGDGVRAALHRGVGDARSPPPG